MSVSNLFLPYAGWRIDPDHRQNRGNGPVITRKMTEEEMEKYRVTRKEGEENMKKLKLPIDFNRALEICREHGTGRASQRIIAEEFGVTLRQAEKYVYNHIKEKLQKMAAETVKQAVQEERKSDINSHEDHPEDTEKYPDIKEVAEEISKEIDRCAVENANSISLKNAVDEMMEMVPANDNINHPKHYTAGRYEIIDIIESVVNSMPMTPFEGYCIGNAIKYLSRWKLKGGVDDLKKAKWYVSKIIKTKETA